MNINDVNVNDKLYMYEVWSRQIYQVTLTQFTDSNRHVKFHWDYIVDRNGNKIADGIKGSSEVSIDYGYLWANPEEAYNAIEKEINDLVENYKNEIKTIEDLVAFPLEHCFDGEEYTDYEAIKAYKIRAKELLNIDLK